MVASLAAFGGKPPAPWKLNPFRQQIKTAAQKELEAKEGWIELKAGLRAFARGR